MGDDRFTDAFSLAKEAILFSERLNGILALVDFCLGGTEESSVQGSFAVVNAVSLDRTAFRMWVYAFAPIDVLFS